MLAGQDVYDGRGWAKHVDADPMCQEPACSFCVVLGLVYDPFQPWKDDSKASASPFLLVNLCASQPNRFRLGVGCHMLGIVDCITRRDIKRDPYDSVLDLVVDELLHLYHVGMEVFDTHLNKRIHVRCKLVLVLSDLQGHRACLRPGGGCIKCTIKAGAKFGNDGRGKSPYHNHYPLLPADHHALRHLLSQLHNQPQQRGGVKVPRTGDETSTWRYRSLQEVALREDGAALPLHPRNSDPASFDPFPGMGCPSVGCFASAERLIRN